MLDGGAICKQLVHRAQAKTLARQARVQLWNAKRQTRGRRSSAGSALQARNLHAQGRDSLRLHKLNSYLSLVMTRENVWRTNRFWKAIFCQAPNPNRAKTARSGICNAVCISRLSVTPVRDSKVQSALRPSGIHGRSSRKVDYAALAGNAARPNLSSMFAVSEDDATAIRAAFHEGGEFSAAIELRRRFPGITDNAQARICARTIAGWNPEPLPPRPVTRLRAKKRA